MVYPFIFTITVKKWTRNSRWVQPDEHIPMSHPLIERTMERYPEAWLWAPLDGPFAFRNVPYILKVTHVSKKTSIAVQMRFQCVLCDSGIINCEKTLQDHVHGKRHQNKYSVLEANRQAWWLDQQVPPNVISSGDDDSWHVDDDTISYIMPFRRWRYNQWRPGMTCQLCGTGDLPTRLEVARHCMYSKRHAMYRSTTYMTWHIECQSLHVRLVKLPPIYQWHVEREMIHYVATKERSFAGLASKTFAWYQVLRTLENYELRAQMVYLELAIWKQSMLKGYSTTIENESQARKIFLKEVYVDLGTLEAIQGFKRTIRVTSGIQEIIQGVIPFLRTIL